MATSVLFVLWTGGIGGAERHTAGLCRALNQLGDRAEVLVVGHSQPFDSTLARGVAVSELGLARGRDALLHRRTLRRALVGFDVCVLPANGFLAPLTRGAVPVLVAMEHGDALNATALLSGVHRLADRFGRSVGAPSIACEIAVSQVSADALQRLPHAERIVTIHNGIELGSSPEAIPARGPATIIGWLGRMTPGKGAELAIRATAALCSTGRAVRLRLAGDGPQRVALGELADELGIADCVTFEGWVEEVDEFWYGCDVGLLVDSGLTESFGLALFEAIAGGVRVVTGASPIQAELLQGAPGVVVAESSDLAAVTGALGTAVDGAPPTAAERAERRGWVEREYSMDACAARYHRLFEELVAHARDAT